MVLEDGSASPPSSPSATPCRCLPRFAIGEDIRGLEGSNRVSRKRRRSPHSMRLQAGHTNRMMRCVTRAPRRRGHSHAADHHPGETRQWRRHPAQARARLGPPPRHPGRRRLLAGLPDFRSKGLDEDHRPLHWTRRGLTMTSYLELGRDQRRVIPAARGDFTSRARRGWRCLAFAVAPLTPQRSRRAYQPLAVGAVEARPLARDRCRLHQASTWRRPFV